MSSFCFKVARSQRSVVLSSWKPQLYLARLSSRYELLEALGVGKDRKETLNIAEFSGGKDILNYNIWAT